MDTGWIIAMVVLAFGAGFGAGRQSGAASASAPPPVPPDPEALEAVRPILASEGKIHAIKAYRELTGVGLRDAKLAVDELERRTEPLR